MGRRRAAPGHGLSLSVGLEATLNLEIRTAPLSGSDLVDDYATGADRLAPFYTGSPWDPNAYLRKAAAVDHRFDSEMRAAAADIVRPTSAGARKALERVIADDGLFVTTGQQPALFGGPLYTIHKALGAVRLAEALERTLDRPVAPLFWIASDDHDWAEANHVHALDRKNQLHRLALSSRSDAPTHSLGRRPLDADVESTLDELSQMLPPTEFKDSALAPIRAAFRPGRSMGEAFGDLMEALFSQFDLLLVDAAHPELKRREAELIGGELDDWSEHAAQVAECTARLEDAGYHAQVPILEGATNAFMEDERGRHRLYRADDGWMLGRGGPELSDGEVRARLESEPERFSPNVLLRPVVESALFPTVAYVAGPGELSYYAQLGGLYGAHDMMMPVIFPRHGVTLIESKVGKVLDKFELGVDDFRPPVHEIAARVMKEETPADVRDAITSLRQTLNQGAERLAEAAERVDPTLRGPVLGVRNTAHVELSDLEKKITRHLKDRNEIGVRQLEKARVNLFPTGEPQERVFNLLPYLVRYGPELLEHLADALDVEIETRAPAWAGVDCG